MSKQTQVNVANVNFNVSRYSSPVTQNLTWSNPDLSNATIVSTTLQGSVTLSGGSCSATINNQKYIGGGSPWTGGGTKTHNFNFNLGTTLITSMKVRGQVEGFASRQDGNIRTSNVVYTITYDDSGDIKTFKIYLGKQRVSQIYIGEQKTNKIFLGDKLI